MAVFMMEFVLDENVMLALEDVIPTYYLMEDFSGQVIPDDCVDGNKENLKDLNSEVGIEIVHYRPIWDNVDRINPSQKDSSQHDLRKPRKDEVLLSDSFQHLGKGESTSDSFCTSEEICPVQNIFGSSDVVECDFSSDVDEPFSNAAVLNHSLTFFNNHNYAGNALGRPICCEEYPTIDRLLHKEKSFLDVLRSRTFIQRGELIQEDLHRPRSTDLESLFLRIKTERSEITFDQLDCIEIYDCNNVNKNASSPLNGNVTSSSESETLDDDTNFLIAEQNSPSDQRTEHDDSNKSDSNVGISEHFPTIASTKAKNMLLMANSNNSRPSSTLLYNDNGTVECSIDRCIESVAASTYIPTSPSLHDVAFKRPKAKKHKKAKKELDKPSSHYQTKNVNTKTAKVATTIRPIATLPTYDEALMSNQQINTAIVSGSYEISTNTNNTCWSSKSMTVPMDENSNCPRSNSILGKDSRAAETTYRHCTDEGWKNSYSHSWNPLLKLPTTKFPSWLDYDHQTLGKMCCNICQVTLMSMYINDDEMFKIINAHFCSSAHITKSLCNDSELFAMVYKFLKRSVDDGSSVYDILKRLSAIVGDKFCVSPPSLKSVFKTFTLANESVFKKILPTFKFSILADACNGYLIIRFINSKAEVKEIFIPSYIKNNTTPIQDFLKNFLHTDAIDTYVLHVTSVKSCILCLRNAKQVGPQLPLRPPNLSDALFWLSSNSLTQDYKETVVGLSYLYSKFKVFFQKLADAAYILEADFYDLFTLKVFNFIANNRQRLRIVCSDIFNYYRDPCAHRLSNHRLEFSNIIGFALCQFGEIKYFWKSNPVNYSFFNPLAQNYLIHRAQVAPEPIRLEEQVMLNVLNSYVLDNWKECYYNRQLSVESVAFLWNTHQLKLFHESQANISTLKIIYENLKQFLPYPYVTLFKKLRCFNVFLEKNEYRATCLNDILKLFITDKRLESSFKDVFDFYVAVALFPFMPGGHNLSFCRLNICKYILSSKFNADLIPDLLNIWLQGPSTDVEIESARISLLSFMN